MSLMSGLYVGTTGLMTSSNALNTTAHNLSNIETEGYTRQQVLLEDKIYNTIGNASVSSKQVGLGVEYAKVRQVRDYFYDQSYRKEAGRSAFYELNYETTHEIETLLGEFDGVAFQDSVADIWTAIQELQKDPSSAVVQGELVNTCSQFLERAQSVYNGLCDYQDNLNARVGDFVHRINELGNKIYDLNIAINKEEVRVQNGEGDIERSISEANDMRDQRNKALDELASLVNINYFTNADGSTEVLIEGVSFVARDRVFEMGTVIESGTGFYTPVWPQNGDAPVFEANQEIASKLNSDIGELKAIIYARGDRRANYTDLLDSDYYNNGGYDVTLERDCIPTNSSIIMNTMAELDNMVHDMMVTINDILLEEQNVDPLNRKYATEDDICDIPELFVRLGTERYEKITDPADPDYGVYEYRYVPEATDVDPTKPCHADISTLYTITNMKINPELLKQPTKLSFVTDDNQTDHAKSDLLVDAFRNTFGALNPNLTMQYNYSDYYSALVGQIATNGSVYESIVNAQEIAVTQLDAARQSVMGTSSNEELTNMIKFQNAYNAASRYITVLNEMLGDIISKLG